MIRPMKVISLWNKFITHFQIPEENRDLKWESWKSTTAAMRSMLFFSLL